MRFREQLEAVRDMGICICDIVIALECDCNFEFDYTDDEFEKLCAFARNIYLKSEYTEEAIARTIDNLIYHEGRTIAQALSMDKFEFFKHIIE